MIVSSKKKYQKESRLLICEEPNTLSVGNATRIEGLVTDFTVVKQTNMLPVLHVEESQAMEKEAARDHSELSKELSICW